MSMERPRKQGWLTRVSLAAMIAAAPALAMAHAMVADTTLNVVDAPQANSCSAYFTEGRVFRKGAVLRQATEAWNPAPSSHPSHLETLHKGEAVVIAGYRNGMACVSDLTEQEHGWVPRQSIAVVPGKATVDKRDWAGVWATPWGSWLTISPNFDNSVSIVDGWAPGSEERQSIVRTPLVPDDDVQHPGSPRDAVFRTQDPPLQIPITHQQLEAFRNGSCHIHAYLLDGILVVSDMSEACGPGNFAGIYYKVETYPPTPGWISKYFKRLH